jgi:PAS domain S-box-containing protein
MIELSEYELETLREDGDFILYRGRHRHYTDASAPVILVVTPASSGPALACLKRMDHEYSLRTELDPAWAASPLALNRYEGRTMLAIKDPGGEPLDQVLRRNHGQLLDLARFLRIAIGLATALGKVHRRGLIHKDIKPANVLVDNVDNVWLTGFGIATQLPRESQAPAPPEIIAGTLAYMAPEQTGRMNRSIDARSDLYSLGITLYEMLTGALPFTAANPLEWVHCHIARQPTPPDGRAAVPKVLSTLTLKLIAKNAEERYQTTSGLEADLRRCLAEWESHGHIDPFPLGAHDISDRLLIPEKLYGREHEIETLLAAFDRVVANGTPELVLVSGYSGVGKSSVVNELNKALVPPRGLFASGKFDQYQRDIPYATLAQAFKSLVRPLLGRSEAELGQWRSALNEALGSNGQLMVNLVPELELVIGKQPPVGDLPPQDAKNRFQMVFRRFLGVFARKEHPLALFLDDLQWLDSATLDLLEQLLTHSEVRHLLLVGAYRDNEVSPSHLLMRTLEAIRKQKAQVHEVVLAPLGLDHIGRLIADSLHCEPDRARPLAQLVQVKTGGNPFFAIQFFTALAEEGLIVFDPVAPAWRWDIDRIRARNYTDNVVELMATKLKRFSTTTQEALKQFACLGNVVDIATLTLVLDDTEEAVGAALREAEHAGLVFQHENAYKFLHDRIQQAAYSLIPEEHRAEIHLRIGRELLASMAADGLAEHVFEIVNQLNRGAALIAAQDEREHLAELNLLAGARAKASTAYASALTYLVAGAELLADDSWERCHELTFALELNRAECEFLIGALSEAEERSTALSMRAANTVEQATVACLRVDVYTTLNQSNHAVDVCLDYLRKIGIEWSPHPTAEEARREYERIWSKIGSRAIEELMELPLMSDPASLATLDVLTKVVPPALYTDANLVSLASCRSVNLSLESGNSDGSCVAYVWLGTIAGPHFNNYKAGFRFGRLGYELVEQRGLKRFQARTYMCFGSHVMPWAKPIQAGRDLLRRAFEAANKIGDLTVAAYSCDALNTNLLASGDPLPEVQREAENGFEFARKAQFGIVIDIITAQLGLIRNLRGLTPKFGSFDDERFEEVRFERHLASDPVLALPECWYWIRKLQARFFAEDYASAVDASLRAQQLLWTSPSLFETAEYHFYGALSYAASWDDAFPGQKQQHFEALATHYRQLEIWAANCPENFENRAALVGAEIARIEGRELEAERMYEKAIKSARANSFVHNEAVANELAARFYAARGFERIAHLYLQDARYCYLRWGADGKVRQLEERYPHLREERDSISPTATIGTPSGQLDIETVVKASQALSSEIVLPKLIDKLMRIAVEHAGAERGLLILLRGDEPQIEAEATTGQGMVGVTVRQTVITPLVLPQSALQHVFRTGERVVLDDASVRNLYSEDEYVQAKHPRSVLCLPIVKQSKLIGALYMENNLTPRAFTSDRVALLEMLASQAAISLENARLYSDLQRSETYLAQGQSVSHTGSFGRDVPSGEIYWSEETYKIFELDRSAKPTMEFVFQRMHPEDRERVRLAIDRATNEKTGFNFEYRMLGADGSVKHIHVAGRVLKTSQGSLESVGAVTDVTAAKQAEDKIRENERELRQILDFAPQQVAVLRPDYSRVYINQASLDYFGLTLEESLSRDRRSFFHPDDWERMISEPQSKFLSGIPHEAEFRLRRKDGKYRWFLFRYNPIRDEQGRIKNWLVAGTDIEDRKQVEQRLENENVALREEIDKASMFEEIVGTSPLLQAVLSRISKVAPTESSVLITGETGTGKELVARAIHRRSKRSSRAFVSVNCAAIPRDLIASELFGHEKGAFTGATQRHIGRFELAEGGTLFLDEIGELPAETQIALLRVLQEHEFERVGGAGILQANVRVIAATNRDLETAIARGTFRSDLFYRLNVFPIEIPPLRKRTEDIPLLVEYFIDRYARKAGKSFQSLNKSSLDLLRSYSWPGNIRELQNVIERSVIVCETENFSVDESWLSRRPPATGNERRVSLSRTLPSQEKAIIEAVLDECGGKVYGPAGAASKLGIPRSTLESKIRSLRINKDQFKT